MERVAVFIDWQNCYHCVREAFHRETDSSPCGQVRPRALSELLAEKGPAGRSVVHIGMYRGQPDPRVDPRTHGAHMRQRAAWEAECGPLLTMRTRALRYLAGRPLGEAAEKGVDVQLAIDAMLLAASGAYDTAILVTTDTDFLPVVEGILALRKERGSPSVEVVGWAGLARGLNVPGVPVRWIGPRDYTAIRDTMDYNVPVAQRRR